MVSNPSCVRTAFASMYHHPILVFGAAVSCKYNFCMILDAFLYVCRLVDQLAAASRTRTKTVAATTPVPEIEVYNLDGSSIFSSDSHHVSALGAASSASYSSGIQSIVVTGVTADALAAIKAADSVAHVIPDLPTAAAVGECTMSGRTRLQGSISGRAC